MADPDGEGIGERVEVVVAIALTVVVLLIGVALMVDGAGHLGGRHVMFHVVATHVQDESAPFGQSGDVEVPVKYGDGYYLDTSGRRHLMSVPGAELRPGMVVRVPLSPLGAQGLQARSGWAALGEFAMGLIIDLICAGVLVAMSRAD